jgi:ComF family protein
MSKLSTIINFIKDIISPKRCYSCKIEWHFLCPQCLQKIQKYNSYCYVCKLKTDNFEVHKKCWKYVYYDKIIVYCHYNNNLIKKLIKDAKFYNRHDIFNDFWQHLSTLFLENENITNKEDFLIISSPMYFLRKLKRWYNQSEILSKSISKNLGIDYNFNIIKKIKHTKQQSKLIKQDREKNLKNVFQINKKYIENIQWKTIIIVDDVISTWTTINEITKILKENKAKKVIGLVIASD